MRISCFCIIVIQSLVEQSKSQALSRFAVSHLACPCPPRSCPHPQRHSAHLTPSLPLSPYRSPSRPLSPFLSCPIPTQQRSHVQGQVSMTLIKPFPLSFAEPTFKGCSTYFQTERASISPLLTFRPRPQTLLLSHSTTVPRARSMLIPRLDNGRPPSPPLPLPPGAHAVQYSSNSTLTSHFPLRLVFPLCLPPSPFPADASVLK
jgi:hypothetical protein